MMHDSVLRIVEDLARKQEQVLLEQLSELVSRGLIVCEVGETLLVQRPDGGVELRRKVRLTLRDQEYVQELEAENKKLKERLSLLAAAVKDL